MAQKPLTVAFVGTGVATEANVRALLDDWLVEDGEYNPPIIPATIRRGHKGLVEVEKWLVDEFEEGNFERIALNNIVTELCDQKDNGSDVALVYIPGEDDPHLDEVKAAIQEGIPVKDMLAGLDDYELPEEPVDSGDTGPNGEKIPTAPGRRTRGRSRTEVEPPLPDDAPDEPPWKTDEPESDSKASESPDDQSPTGGAVRASAADTSTPEPHSGGGMAVVLSQATIEAVLQAFALMAADIKASVVAELPASAKPKPTTEPYYYNEDEGTYRKVEGRGRPRTGERRVDLTPEEVKQYGL